MESSNDNSDFSHWVIQKRVYYPFKKQKNYLPHSKNFSLTPDTPSLQLCPLNFYLQGENAPQIHSSPKTKKCLLSALNLQGRTLLGPWCQELLPQPKFALQPRFPGDWKAAESPEDTAGRLEPRREPEGVRSESHRGTALGDFEKVQGRGG